MNRGTGRTLDMVKGLPAGGSIVIVHNGTMVDYVKRMIRDVRGSAVALVTEVRSIVDRWAVDRILAGAAKPIYVDHAFWEHAPREVFDLVDMFVNRRPQREPDVLSLQGQLKRLDIEEGDTLVFRTPRQLTAEEFDRIADQVEAFARGHGFREIRILGLDMGSDLTVHRPQVPQACQEPRRTPFGCLEDPRVTSPFEVTSASISEAVGGCRPGRAALPAVGG